MANGPFGYVGNAARLGGSVPVGGIQYGSASPGVNFSACDGTPWTGPTNPTLNNSLSSYAYGGYNYLTPTRVPLANQNNDATGLNTGSTAHVPDYIIVNNFHVVQLDTAILFSKPSLASLTWTAVNTAPAEAILRTLAFFSGSYFINANASGTGVPSAFKTSSITGSWTNINADLGTGNVLRYFQVVNGKLWSFEPSAQLVSTDGTSWSSVSPGIAAALREIVRVNGVWWAKTSGSSVYYASASDPTTATWTLLTGSNTNTYGWGNNPWMTACGTDKIVFSAVTTPTVASFFNASSAAYQGDLSLSSFPTNAAVRALPTDTGIMFRNEKEYLIFATAFNVSSALTHSQTDRDGDFWRGYIKDTATNITFSVSGNFSGRYLFNYYGRLKPLILGPATNAYMRMV